VYDKNVSDNYVDNYVTENGKSLGCSWWWLRTQPGSSSHAAFMGTRASIRDYGRVILIYYGVRSALNLNM
jgi:hypothetical protein